MNILVLLTAMYYLSMPCHSKHVPLSPSDSASDAPTAVIVEAVAVAVAVAVMTASAAVTTEHIPLFYPPSAPFWSCSMPSGVSSGMPCSSPFLYLSCFVLPNVRERDSTWYSANKILEVSLCMRWRSQIIIIAVTLSRHDSRTDTP